MEITWECPSCGISRSTELDASAHALTCASCKALRPIAAGSIDATGLTKCAACATDDLYVQKDFPQGLGLVIVIVGFIIGTIFWYYNMPLLTYGVLILSAAIDLLLYRYVREVTICYRCLSQYRGSGSNPGGRYKPFDLAVGERYRQERIRAEELRAAGKSTRSGAG